MPALRLTLALLLAMVTLTPKAAHGAVYTPFVFNISSITDGCDCIKVIITSLYRAGETLDNIMVNSGDGLNYNTAIFIEPDNGCVALYVDPVSTLHQNLVKDSDFASKGAGCQPDNGATAVVATWGSNLDAGAMLANSAKVPIDFAKAPLGIQNLTYPCAGNGATSSPRPVTSPPAVAAVSPAPATLSPVAAIPVPGTPNPVPAKPTAPAPTPATPDPTPTPDAVPTPSPTPAPATETTPTPTPALVAATTAAPSAVPVPAPAPSASRRRFRSSGLRSIWLLFFVVLLSFAGLPTPAMGQAGQGIEIQRVLSLECPPPGQPVADYYDYGSAPAPAPSDYDHAPGPAPSSA